MSRPDLPPTYIAMGMRRQWSDEHLFEEADYHPGCNRCGMRWNHPNHCTREQDRNAVKAMADQIKGE